MAILLVGVPIVVAQTVIAQDDAAPTPPQPSPMHPTFPLLDAAGDNVLDSGNAVSTMTTCGACHDAEFIAGHSFHADLGLANFGEPGSVANGRSWDTSPGAFGRWNPLTYDYLSPADDAVIDLTTPAWIMQYGARHVGGGPATTSRDGRSLLDLLPDADNPETGIHDPVSGVLVPWDWQESGVVEMNCFLCHTPNPDNEARIAELAAGNFGWANTATLANTGLVSQEGSQWVWNTDAFDDDGHLKQEFVTLHDPATQNCGQCHGVTHSNTETPLTLTDYVLGDYSSLTTGQIMSPQKIANSGINVQDKNTLSRSFDVHAERVIDCDDCHYSLNNPVYYQESPEQRPEFLTFDPRRIDLSEYLHRPLHQFAKGQSAQGTIAPELDNTLRRCESCHNVEATHNWLPYKERHTTAVSCESCHVPKLYAPALSTIDWTVLQADGQPVMAYRGIEGSDINATTLVAGYAPVLLPRTNADGSQSLAPFNLITSWYWIYGQPARPVPLTALQAAYLDGDAYHAAVLDVFDADGSGALDESELVIDDEAKETAVADRLAAQGLDNPRIAGDVQPYSINHNVTTDEFVTKDCRACHGEDSRTAQPLALSNRTPGGVLPTLGDSGSVTFNGEIVSGDDGTLTFRPQPEAAGLYVLGYNAVAVIDWIGILMFLGVLVGASVHGGLRFVGARRMAGQQHAPEIQEVYMYDVYERLWHWLQTAAILLLLFTGLIIHKPDMFGIFSFSYVVQVHNVLAAVLVINAALSLFYHLVSGEIQQYLPRPRGFFDQTFEQAKFYLHGIFRGEPHPFAKTRRRKLNPLQQITYFGILNVLLPLQIITGALMWGAQRWPEIANRLGGLPFLGPAHTLIAWSFASFIVMHVYLTTTGHTPLAGIKAMMLGWDEIEIEDRG